MEFLEVLTSEQRLQRILELRELERQEEQEKEDQKKNRNFTQVYDAGFERMKAFMKDGQGAAGQLYVFLAQHLEPSVGAAVATQEFLAQEIGVSSRTIRRASEYLEGKKAIYRIKLSGTAYVYCLNPDEIWKSWDDKKKYAAFNTKTLAGLGTKDEIMRRLKVMGKAIKKEAEAVDEGDED